MKKDPIDILEGYSEITKKKYLSLSVLKAFVTCIGCILSLGILALVLYWYESVYFLMFYSEVDEIDKTEYIWFISKNNEDTYCRLYQKEVKFFKNDVLKKCLMFDHGVHKFYWDQHQEVFLNVGKSLLRFLKEEFSKNSSFFKSYKPNTNFDVKYFQNLFGPNQIKVKHKNVVLLFFYCFFTPLNCFELVFMIACFFIEQYIFGVQLSIYITIQTIIKFVAERNKVNKINSFANNEDMVKVIRVDDNGVKKILRVSSKDITVGDIILMKADCNFTCDIILISGSCNVNEAVLTGETTPIFKQPASLMSSIQDQNQLFAGSECLSIRGNREIVGLVSGTGWNTFKGSLVDNIVNSSHHMFKFDKDFLIFGSIAYFIYVSSQCFLIYLELQSGIFNSKLIIFRLMFVMTAAFPPSAMLTFIISTAFADYRLEKEGITCMNNDKLKEIGRVKVIGFDKTGTLTDEHVEFSGISICGEDSDQLAVVSDDIESFDFHPKSREITEFLACCNNLIDVKGEIKGETIDVQQFKKSEFKLKFEEVHEVDSDKNLYMIEKEIETSIFFTHRNDQQRIEQFLDQPNEENTLRQQSDEKFKVLFPSSAFITKYNLKESSEYTILRVFTFTPERKRLGVLVRRPVVFDESSKSADADLIFFCKGAPETIGKLCKPESLPANFQQSILDYSMKGMRILAFGYKEIQKENVNDDMVKMESDLTFLGLLLLQNKIKSNTVETIKTLKKSNIHVLMITGDNIFTAINAGFSSQIIESYQKVYVCQVLEGKTLKWFVFSQSEYLKSLRTINIPKQESVKNIKIADMSKSRNQSVDDRRFTKEHIQKGILEMLKDCEASGSVIALEGDAFDILMNENSKYPDVCNQILQYTVIFGRSKPFQKQLIIRSLKNKYFEKDILIGFVGDGSNDCKALAEANMGLCIGCKEAIMTASFSSTQDNISTVIETLCIGRFVLENLLQVMKQAMYSGFISSLVFTIICYHDLLFTQFDLVTELFHYLPVYLVICYSHHHNKLGPLLPKAGFLNKEVLVEFLVALGIGFFFILGAYFIATLRFGAKTPKDIVFTLMGINHDDHFFVEGKHILIIFAINNLFVAAGFHRSLPFKRPFYVNPILWSVFFTITMIILLPFYIELIFGSSFQAFYFKYSRFPNIDDSLGFKMLLYAIVVGFFMFLVLRIIQNLQLRMSLKAKQAKSKNVVETVIGN